MTNIVVNIILSTSVKLESLQDITNKSLERENQNDHNIDNSEETEVYEELFIE